MSSTQASPEQPSELEIIEALAGLRPVSDPQLLLQRAVALGASRFDASVGWVALLSEPKAACVAWSVGVGFTGQPPISNTVVNACLDSGSTQRVASVLGHPQYKNTHSGTNFQITSVLCTPIGNSSRAVVYLQDRSKGFFTNDHQKQFERFAASLSPWVDQIAAELVPQCVVAKADVASAYAVEGETAWLRPIEPKHIVPWTEAKVAFRRHYLRWAMHAHDGNKTATARTLSLARARMFSLVKELGLSDEDSPSKQP